jgi:hypothetical protein
MRSQWHRFYVAEVAAPPTVLFDLVADMPSYGHWLPGSAQFGETTDVEPYPVKLGTRYHDGKPDRPGNAWWGTVTGFQPPGAIDFHHTIEVKPLRATVDVHIHYSFESPSPDKRRTSVGRWLVLDVIMPWCLRPLRRLVTSRFDQENLRTIAAIKQHAEANLSERSEVNHDSAQQS